MGENQWLDWTTTCFFLDQSQTGWYVIHTHRSSGSFHNHATSTHGYPFGEFGDHFVPELHVSSFFIGIECFLWSFTWVKTKQDDCKSEWCKLLVTANGLHCRHNLNQLPEATDQDVYFKSKCRQMFVGGLVNKFTRWGGQQAVANLVGVDQSTVSRGTKKVTSPHGTSLKRKRRQDALELSAPDHITTAQSFWVRKLSNNGF